MTQNINENNGSSNPPEQQSYRGQQSYQQPGVNGQPGAGGQPGQPMLSSKERKKMEKLAKAKARTTEDWMKREKKIVIIFSIVCAMLLILAIIGFALAGSSGSTEYVSDDSSYSESSDTDSTTYEAVTADELLDAFNENAASAAENYEGKSLAITGKLVNTDTDSEYISIEPLNNEFTIDSILCYTDTEALQEQAKQLKAGQKITVKGTITEVDSVFGYYLDTDSIEVD